MPELGKWDERTKIITVRLTEKEYYALLEKVHEENRTNYRLRNKATISSIARDMIRYCLIKNIKK